MSRLSLRSCAALVLLLAGCSSVYLPARQAQMPVRLPSQQLTVAEAAEATFVKFNFTEYSGSTAHVQIVGVFPHSRADLLDYLRAGIEGKLASDGVAVEPVQYDYIADQAGTVYERATYPKTQLRVVVSVLAAGADKGESDYFLLQQSWVNGLVRLKVAVFKSGAAGGAASIAQGTESRTTARSVLYFLKLPTEYHGEGGFVNFLSSFQSVKDTAAEVQGQQ